MHIRILALGSRGDVQPYIALGLGLQRAGLDISLAVPANFKTFVESYGLPTITAQVDMQQMVARGRGGRKTKWEFFHALLNETLRLSEGADLLIYAPAAIFSAPHAAEKLNIPAIPTALQPFLHPTADFPAVGMPALDWGGWYNRFTYTFLEGFTWTFTKRMVNKWRAEKLGLPPATNPMTRLREARVPTLYGISPSVLPKPAEWGEHVHVVGYWFLPPGADWQPPASLVDFLQQGKPPVYIGFGSMASRDPQQTAQIVLDAVKSAGVRAIIASGWGGLSTENAPDNIFVIDAVPHEWLFPQVAAVVHHGGAGTTAAGLQAGVPTIIVPFKGDQPFWGKRVADLGAGPQPIPRRSLTADNLADALRQAVDDPSIRQTAQALGERIRAEDGVSNGVSVVQQIIQNQSSLIVNLS